MYMIAKRVAIIDTVMRLQTNHRGVMPHQVQAFAGISLSERRWRAHMERLAQEGLLVRVGGQNAKKGYRLADTPMAWLRLDGVVH